jgi:hypothetical protein
MRGRRGHSLQLQLPIRAWVDELQVALTAAGGKDTEGVHQLPQAHSKHLLLLRGLIGREQLQAPSSEAGVHGCDTGGVRNVWEPPIVCCRVWEPTSGRRNTADWSVLLSSSQRILKPSELIAMLQT